jgi:hypothetical protein
MSRPKETAEERAARKEREQQRDRPRETEEERAARKERERAERDRPRETEEERAARKERERAERDRPRETDEERAARKERERAERDRPRETEEERAARKERERAERDRPRETAEERAARKEKERSAKEVVHKPLPTPPGLAQPAPAPKVEPVIQGRNPKAAPVPQPDPDDYADDFEDGFEVEALIEAQKAVAAENAAIKRQQQLQQAGEAAGGKTNGSAATSGVTNSEPQLVGTSRIDASDLERQRYRQQFEADLQRATALRRLVDLDEMSAVIADIPPLSEHDLYLRSYGIARQQNSSQCPADGERTEVEIQVDRVLSRTRAAQCPEDLGLFPERMALVQKSAAKQPGIEEDSSQATSIASASKSAQQQQSVDPAALSIFLQRVFPVVRTLLDENDADRQSTTQRTKSSLQFSSSYVTLQSPMISSRSVAQVVYSRIATQYVAVLYGAPPVAQPQIKGTENPLDKYAGVVFLWNTNDPSGPDKILVTHSALTTVCFSASRPHFIYGGTKSGAVCVWDIREPDSQHGGDRASSRCAFRTPSFSSELQNENHRTAIVSVTIAGYNGVLGLRKEDSEQVVSMDQSGSVSFWMLSEGGVASGGGSKSATHHHHGHGSSPTKSLAAQAGASTSGPASSVASYFNINESDHGQNIFSNVRIVRVSTINTEPPASSSGSPSSPAGFVSSWGHRSASDLDFVPTDASRFVVAAGRKVQHISRYGSIAAPAAYGPEVGSVSSVTSQATCVRFSTLDSRILVVGYADGSVRLFMRDEPTAQLAVHLSSDRIVAVRLHASLKWVTFALDSAGTIYTIDHAQDSDKETPLFKTPVVAPETGKCTCLDMPCDEKIETRMALGFERGGIVQVHTMSERVVAHNRNDRWL